MLSAAACARRVAADTYLTSRHALRKNSFRLLPAFAAQDCIKTAIHTLGRRANLTPTAALGHTSRRRQQRVATGLYVTALKERTRKLAQQDSRVISSDSQFAFLLLNSARAVGPASFRTRRVIH